MPNEYGSHVKGWDATAPKYDLMTAPIEGWLLGPSRTWIFQRAHGKVLEIGVGTGINLEYVPKDVDYIGTDVSPEMIEHAKRRAAQIGRTVEFRLADATALPFADQSFDCVVSTYVFCCVPDEKKAFEEALRVLKPGGRLLLANHVGSHHLPIYKMQGLLDKVTVPRMGEHFSRQPLTTLRGLGAEIVEVEHSFLGIIERIHARRPAQGEQVQNWTEG